MGGGFGIPRHRKLNKYAGFCAPRPGGTIPTRHTLSTSAQPQGRAHTAHLQYHVPQPRPPALLSALPALPARLSALPLLASPCQLPPPPQHHLTFLPLNSTVRPFCQPRPLQIRVSGDPVLLKGRNKEKGRKNRKKEGNRRMKLDRRGSGALSHLTALQ